MRRSFRGMQIRIISSYVLPRVVSVFALCADLPLICPLCVSSLLSCLGTSVLLHAEMVPNSVFCVYQRSPLRSVRHYDSPPSACPVLLRSAPGLFPFHWQCPPFPPLSHRCGILLIPLSFAGQGATQGEESPSSGDTLSPVRLSSCFCCFFSIVFLAADSER